MLSLEERIDMALGRNCKHDKPTVRQKVTRYYEGVREDGVVLVENHVRHEELDDESMFCGDCGEELTPEFVWTD